VDIPRALMGLSRGCFGYLSRQSALLPQALNISSGEVYEQ